MIEGVREKTVNLVTFEFSSISKGRILHDHRIRLVQTVCQNLVFLGTISFSPGGCPVVSTPSSTVSPLVIRPVSCPCPCHPLQLYPYPPSLPLLSDTPHDQNFKPVCHDNSKVTKFTVSPRPLQLWSIVVGTRCPQITRETVFV